MNEKLRFVFVVGGVLSGIGKGVVTASISKLLQSYGYKVTAIKIDPYVNIDAGTMRPTEHGEVFVTDDGGEIDQDLGTYERFLDITIPKKNNITTGQIYLEVIKRERALGYGGRDVQIIPDVMNEVKRRILEASRGYEIAVVEVGGTTGDIENLVFLYAIRNLMNEYPSVSVMVTYAPFLRTVGELKTKPTQHAVAKLRETGIFPDFLVVRSEMGLDEIRKKKISKSTFIPEENIIDNPDVDSIYRIPILFEEQKVIENILKKLNLKKRKYDMEAWRKFVEKIDKSEKEINIAIVGKYVSYGKSEHKDVYVSVIEALKHASYNNYLKPKITQISSLELEKDGYEEILKDFDGIIVPGGFGDSGVEGKINAIRYARENDVPFLGLCYGMQLAVVEYARNVCGLRGAHTTEVDPNTPYPVIDIMPEQKKLIEEGKYGATMRLGAYPAILKKGTLVYNLYKKERVYERHRHRYEVNPDFVEILENGGLVFSGTSPDGRLMEFLELPNHRFFVATQAHPEFKSRPLNPHPLFVGFINAIAHKKGFVQ